MSNLRARLQMLNTINAKNPILTNSTTTATKSYSSQCRLPEGMMFVPVSNGLFLHAKIGGHLTSRLMQIKKCRFVRTLRQYRYH